MFITVTTQNKMKFRLNVERNILSYSESQCGSLITLAEYDTCEGGGEQVIVNALETPEQLDSMIKYTTNKQRRRFLKLKLLVGYEDETKEAPRFRDVRLAADKIALFSNLTAVDYAEIKAKARDLIGELPMVIIETAADTTLSSAFFYDDHASLIAVGTEDEIEALIAVG